MIRNSPVPRFIPGLIPPLAPHRLPTYARQGDGVASALRELVPPRGTLDLTVMALRLRKPTVAFVFWVLVRVKAEVNSVPQRIACDLELREV